MASAPPTLLPANPSEFHAYAFANACLRVYTIVSLRSRFRKDPAAQTEASRGLHWEMAALFDHLSACKMYGPVPIPTAVVPMLTHYTNLYAVTANPAVDIHAFPFEHNEFMEGRGDQIQGNKWWEPLLETAHEAPQSQLVQQAAPAEAQSLQSDEGSHEPMQTDPPQPTQPPAQPPANAPPTRDGEQSPKAPHEQQPQQTTTLSTAANPQAPFFAVGQSAALAPTTTPYVPPVHVQQPGAQRFIPYVPPGGVLPVAHTAAPVQPAQPSQSAPAGRPAIIAPPVKAPKQRRRAVKTAEFVDDEARAEATAAESVSQGPAGGQTGEPVQQENGAASASVSQAQRKRAAEVVRVEDYTKLHEGASACGNCITHSRKCLTAKGGRFKRCLECRTRQSKCVWPVPDAATPPTDGTTPATKPPVQPPAEPPQESVSAPSSSQHSSVEATACVSASGKPRLIAEVVLTPMRRKRKAAEVGTSGESPSRRSMRLRSRGPVRLEEEEEEEEPRRSASPLTSVPSSVAEVDAALRGGFEERRAAAHGDAYVRERLALLVDMARTAEMRLADVLGRVAELEAANHRMEKMLAGLGVAAPKTSPRRK